MSLQLFVAVTLAGYAFVVLVNSLMACWRHGTWREGWLWLLVNALVLVLTVVALELAPDHVGTIVGVFAVPFVVMPVVLWQVSRKRLLQWRYGDAALASRVAAILHPSPTARLNAALCAAQAIDSSKQQLAALEALKPGRSPQELAAIDVVAGRVRDDWPALLKLASVPNAAGIGWLEVRALGEIGRIDDMAQAYARQISSLAGSDRHMTALFVQGFCGRPAAVERLLDTRLAILADDIKIYWRLIARLAADPDDQTVRAELATLADTTHHEQLRLAARRHLGRSRQGRLQELTEPSRAAVDAIEAELAAQTKPGAASARRLAPATYALLAVITTGFLFQLYHGATDDARALVDLGALWPPYILRRGEWWRLATATLLHLNWVHFAFNAVALLTLGSALEQRLGWIRLLIAYVVCGLASSGGVLWLMTNGWIRPAVLVGASGAILGLLGVLVVDILARFLRDHSGFERDQLLNIGLLIAIQVAVDSLVPQISSATHMVGFASGLLVGVAFLLRRRQPGA